ncbi:MAG: CYTH domain-containing protein [Desulfoprunum sp.]|nr:CYTH domain-containing protein [Desulfoprunum sp.]
MATEIERKFLPANDGWRGLGQGLPYCQGYICAGNGQTVRVRTVAERGYLTVKGATCGIARLEYEYQIPHADALEMLETLCFKPLIVKIRYRIPVAGFIWEVDEFLEENKGLIVAEIELQNQEQTFIKPSWIGREVTDDPRYRNSSLIKNPYSLWRDK